MQTPACANCKNVHCNVTDIDDYATNILEILDNSIKTATIKRNKTKARSKVVPAWSAEVKP